VSETCRRCAWWGRGIRIKISVHSKQSMFTNCDPTGPVLMCACRSNNFCAGLDRHTFHRHRSRIFPHADQKIWYNLRRRNSHTNTRARTRASTHRAELLLMLHHQHLLEAESSLAGQIVHPFINFSPTSQGTGSLYLRS